MLDVYRGPIGKGDTLESPLWAFYRDWLYREEMLIFFRHVEVGWVCWMYRGPRNRAPISGSGLFLQTESISIGPGVDLYAKTIDNNV